MIVFPNEGSLRDHQDFVTNQRPCLDNNDLSLGDVASFIYDGKLRVVMTVHPDWEHKFHALDLKLISRELVLKLIVPKMPKFPNPKLFYDTVYKPTGLYPLDAYRTYKLDKIETIDRYDYVIPDSMWKHADDRFITETEAEDE